MYKARDVFRQIIKGKRYDIRTKELWVRTFIEFAKFTMNCDLTNR